MSNRRRVLKIKNQFQDQMILELMIVIFVFINALVIVSFFALDTIQDISRLKFTLAVALTLGEMGGLVILYYYTLRQSHRIAGPVYLLEKRLREIGSGNLSGKLHLRKGDYFQDTGALFNESIDHLRGRMLDLRQSAQALKEKSERGEADSADWAQFLQQLEAIRVARHPATNDAAAAAASLDSPALAQPR